MLITIDRRFRLGVIALDSRFGSRPVTTTSAMSPQMCLRSLEEAAADQVAEQMAHEQAVASGSMRDVPEARSIIAQVSGSRSGERNGHEEDDESMSDDSGSELPQPLSAGNAGPLPRTFDEFRRHWGTRLKDVAAHYGVPESGLSKVLYTH